MGSKDEARAESMASRALRNEAQIQQVESNLLRHDWDKLCPGKFVTCYVSMTGEPPTNNLRAHLKSLGKTVLLPIMKPGRALSWGIDDGELTVNNYGVAEPIETELTPAIASLMIIPALRAGRDGSRLGRGAGYYDRVLEKTPRTESGGPLRLVLVFADELVDSVPHESHDQTMDGVITPTELYLLPK